MRKYLISIAMLALLLGGKLGLGASLLQAAPAAVSATGAAPPALPFQQTGPVRRESGPPAPNGPAPRTGPAAPFQPLTIPNFGANVRANTDPQSPNRAQQEPSIAVNPTNVLDVVAAAKDERAGTNTKQVWIYTSTDGGVTWINQQFPLLAPASPFSSDPVVTFSDDGQCYVTALPYGGGTHDGVQVARSLDGGITFSTGVQLPGSNPNSDKEWTWIDNFPSSPYYHRLYTAWMDFSSGSVIHFNYSSDRGITWSAMVTVGNANQFPMPVVFPNGDVIVTYDGGTVGYRRSTNGGVSFGAFQSISSLTSPPCPPDDSGCGIWRLNAIPATGIDPTNGDAVVTWSDGRTGKAVVYYSRSTDNGATWSAAAQLSPPTVANTYQVEPWVVADEAGTWHAIWYDDHDNPNTSIFNIDYSQSTDDGATWSTAVRISTATSDLRIGIPSSYNLAAGDYINIAAAHNNVYGVWTDTRSGTGEDIYVVRGIINQGTPTPTVTGTPPVTLTPTLTPTPCLGANSIVNGGFETGSLAPWVAAGGNPNPTIDNTHAHTGTFSGLLGTLSGGEPTGDSILYQQVTVPAAGGTLSYWYFPLTTDTITFDWQDAYITDTSGNILATIMHLCANDGIWENQTFNMAPYAGQTVRVEFLVHQDGFGDLTSMNVDDVALQPVIGCGTATATVTGTPPTATRTSTATTTAGAATSTPTATAPPSSTVAPSSTVVPSNTVTVAPSSTVPPTQTPGGPTATPVPPTATRVPPTQTPGGPTATPVPPTATVRPTNTVGPSATPCTLSFTDVHPTDYFYTPVLYLACHGVISGYANGDGTFSFRPYNNTTRSQMVKIVILGFQRPIVTPVAGNYTLPMCRRATPSSP